MDTEKLYNLGEEFEKNKNYEEMEKHYLMAIDGGNTKAMVKLGDYYKDLKNYVKMGRYYLMAVKKEDSQAMRKMGDYYKDLKDYVKMGEYYLMAIEKKDSEAMVCMGNYQYDYLFSELVKNIRSNYHIATISIPDHILFENSSIIMEHNYEIIKYFSMAIDYGNSNAMNNLGLYYWKMFDDVLMGKYFLMAIEKGNPDAMCNLGFYYGSIKNYDEMEKYYLMSLRNKDDKKYKEGRLICYPEEYKKIMNNKYKTSIFNFCRKKEYNVEDHNFVKISKEKIKEGSINDMVKLGVYYDKKDPVLMGKYYLMAIERGNDEAMKYLGDYYLDSLNNLEKKNNLLKLCEYNFHKQIKKYYSMAIEKGNINAMYSLGLFYENKKNYNEMKKYYLMVLKSNNNFKPDTKMSEKFEKIKNTYLAETNELQPLI